jgi:hypothetical protein
MHKLLTLCIALASIGAPLAQGVMRRDTSMEEADCARRAKRPSFGLFRNLEDAGFRSFGRVF